MIIFQVMAIVAGAVWLRTICRWMKQKPAHNMRARSTINRG